MHLRSTDGLMRFSPTSRRRNGAGSRALNLSNIFTQRRLSHDNLLDSESWTHSATTNSQSCLIAGETIISHGFNDHSLGMCSDSTR
jgi:hypothetical protein